jgi:hypothetical protein
MHRGNVFILLWHNNENRRLTRLRFSELPVLEHDQSVFGSMILNKGYSIEYQTSPFI